jgi:hypothetical protein
MPLLGKKRPAHPDAKARLHLPQFDGTTPITVDGDIPQKRFYRQRAHCNPLAHNDTFA